MKNRITLLNCPIDKLSMLQTVDLINEGIQNNKRIKHVVVNVAKIVYMQKDRQLYDYVTSSDIINADGLPIVWGSKFLGDSLPERVAGIDLMQELVSLAYKQKYKVFFFGAEEKIVAKVCEIYTKQYSPYIIAGYRNGYYREQEEENVVAQIANSKAHILFVGISSPQKEAFLNKYKHIINIPFIMGVGGSFDVIAGKTKRAPLWMQKIGMEWFYRLMQEPRRMWRRYLYTNFMFIFYVLREKFTR